MCLGILLLGLAFVAGFGVGWAMFSKLPHDPDGF